MSGAGKTTEERLQTLETGVVQLTDLVNRLVVIVEHLRRQLDALKGMTGYGGSPGR